MPKIKTNSSSKKRFKVSARKKVMHKQAGKIHGMTKKSHTQITKLRKNASLAEGDRKKILKHFLPYEN